MVQGFRGDRGGTRTTARFRRARDRGRAPCTDARGGGAATHRTSIPVAGSALHGAWTAAGTGGNPRAGRAHAGSHGARPCRGAAKPGRLLPAPCRCKSVPRTPAGRRVKHRRPAGRRAPAGGRGACAMFAKVISKVKPSQESRQLISTLFKIATDNAKELLSGFGVGAPP